MPIWMSKFIEMGIPIYEVVNHSTAIPARIIRRPDLGSLSVGRDADIAVFQIEKGDFRFIDSGLFRMRGDRRLLCHMTIRSGKVLWDLNGISCADWETSEQYVKG